MKTNRIRSVVIVSDLHVGSECALCPSEDDPGEGPGYVVRDWLRKRWEDYWVWVWARCDPSETMIVVNADCIEGRHHGNKQLCLNGTALQAKACARLLAPKIADAALVYITEGTECHTQEDEQVIGDMLTQEYGVRLRKCGDSFTHPRLKLRINGLIHSIGHHIGTTTRPWLEANQLGMTLAADRMESVNACEEPTDIIVRAHRHIGGLSRTTCGLAVTTPSWQFATRHVLKIKSEARPIVGGSILSYKEKDHGEFPEVLSKEFRPKPEQAIDHDGGTDREWVAVGPQRDPQRTRPEAKAKGVQVRNRDSSRTRRK